MPDFHLSALNLKPLQSHQMILHLLSKGNVIHVTKSKLLYTQVSVQNNLLWSLDPWKETLSLLLLY